MILDGDITMINIAIIGWGYNHGNCLGIKHGQLENPRTQWRFLAGKITCKQSISQHAMFDYRMVLEMFHGLWRFPENGGTPSHHRCFNIIHGVVYQETSWKIMENCWLAIGFALSQSIDMLNHSGYLFTVHCPATGNTMQYLYLLAYIRLIAYIYIYIYIYAFICVRVYVLMHHLSYQFHTFRLI